MGFREGQEVRSLLQERGRSLPLPCYWLAFRGNCEPFHQTFKLLKYSMEFPEANELKEAILEASCEDRIYNAVTYKHLLWVYYSKQRDIHEADKVVIASLHPD